MNTPTCRSCGQYVVWMKTQRGKNMPVDAESVDEGNLDYDEDGKPLFDRKQHISHFDTCPNADEHRKRSR